jgi:1,4-dihydroxy-6-naphthoate synthase
MEQIRVAHSPDSDDAFMFYALATGKVATGDLEFVHHLADIESLNRTALDGEYEVSAVSIHAYAYLHETYALMNVGASMGEGYGPAVVARGSFDPTSLKGMLIGVPGEWTSAFLALKIYSPNVRHRVLPFDRIMAAVAEGEVDAGVVIHEGQISYRAMGLNRILDLGEWWKAETGLPLPLGGNVIRRDLGEEKSRRIADLIAQSVQYAFDHRAEALEYALQFGRGLDLSQGDRFVSMYVNSRTLDYGDDGRRAVQVFLDRGYSAGVIPHRVRAVFL